MQIGDTVSVVLCGKTFIGKIGDIFQNYAWTNEKHYEVNGDLPVPFVTITSNVTKLNGETA